MYAKEGVEPLWRSILHDFTNTKYYSEVRRKGCGDDGPCRQGRLAWDVGFKIYRYRVLWDDGEKEVSEKSHGRRGNKSRTKVEKLRER